MQFFHIEDIFLGQYSLRGAASPELRKYLKGKMFTLGGHAPKMEGIRVIPTADDELMLDLTAVWGSSMQASGNRNLPCHVLPTARCISSCARQLCFCLWHLLSCLGTMPLPLPCCIR